MTIKEKTNLLIVKQKLSDDFDCSNITDTELYEIVDNKCLWFYLLMAESIFWF